jgi:hypothetical protein
VFVRGGIYRFNYYWSWQRDIEKQSQRTGKTRPVCLLIESKDGLFLFPTTSLEPSGTSVFLEVPKSEWKNAKLNRKSWVILDEYNRIKRDGPYDFHSIKPEGVFGKAFLNLLIKAAIEAANQRKKRAEAN